MRSANLPHKPPSWEETPISAEGIMKRVVRLPKGFVPDDTEYLTCGVDLGKHLAHWIVVAWRDGATGHIVDYGRFEVASEQFGVEQALLTALREFRDVVDTGWARSEDEPRVPDQVWIDSGWQPEVVYRFCRECDNRFRPAKGHGAGQHMGYSYRRPKKTGPDVRFIGEGYHITLLKRDRVYLVETDADHWKTWVHRRLSMPMGTPGAMTLYQAMRNDHLSLSKHLTAERQIQEFVPGKGTITRWERVRRANHWFDTLYVACAAGHLCGARLIAPESVKTIAPTRRVERPTLTMPDGRPFLVTERGS